MEATMGQAIKPTALVVEDDLIQRTLVSTLLEECEMNVIECESGEAAALVLDKVGGCLSLMFTDVNLAGVMNGVELAGIARKRFPDLKVIVTSGDEKPKLPSGMTFMSKPWRPLDVLREAEAAAA